MTYGLSPEHLTKYVIRPTLNYMQMGGKQAEVLMLGTAMVESRLSALHQYGGPARSIWQIEPATHDDIWKNWLEYRLDIKQAVLGLTAKNYYSDWAHKDELWGNLPYGCVMARLVYQRHKDPLPPLEAEPMADYHKKIYNTFKGKTDTEESAEHFHFAINTIKRI